MPKIPRNIYGKDLCKALKKYEYEKTRQTGSHIRLTKSSNSIACIFYISIDYNYF